MPYPSTLRDLLIRVAQAGLVQAKWTNLEEWDMEAKSADDFILDQIDLSHDVVYGDVAQILKTSENTVRWWRQTGTVPQQLWNLDGSEAPVNEEVRRRHT